MTATTAPRGKAPGMHEHDGYAPHSREVRADHGGVERRSGAAAPWALLDDLQRRGFTPRGNGCWFDLPVHQPGDGTLAPAAGRIGAHAAPLTLTLGLLAELEKTGRARKADDPKGNHWYLTVPEEAPDA